MLGAPLGVGGRYTTDQINNLIRGPEVDKQGQPLNYNGTMKAIGSDGKEYHRYVTYVSDLSPQEMDDFIFKERAKKVLFTTFVLGTIAITGILIARYILKL